MSFVLFVMSFVHTETVIFTEQLLLALLLGFLIGLEREHRHKDAGISTHMLVIGGAMLFTFFSTGTTMDSDGRIAAAIVTGIGFLGAGMILKDGIMVRNLTTAASLWYASAIGMAIGFGYWQIAILASIAAVLIPRIPHFEPQVTELIDPVEKLLEELPKQQKKRKTTTKTRVVKKVTKKVVAKKTNKIEK